MSYRVEGPVSTRDSGKNQIESDNTTVDRPTQSFLLPILHWRDLPERCWLAGGIWPFEAVGIPAQQPVEGSGSPCGSLVAMHDAPRRSRPPHCSRGRETTLRNEPNNGCPKLFEHQHCLTLLAHRRNREKKKTEKHSQQENPTEAFYATTNINKHKQQT